ncbi:MAG: hypothetical protein JJU36_15295 [Phycisphaeraceae bacterium]|nr:hypothetical protein [Phycisphaeraceae bacterium]
MSFGHLPGYHRRSSLVALALALLAPAPAEAVRIQFDYSFDDHAFFADPLRREALEYAAMTFERFIDSLSPISPSGGNQWNARFFDPATGQQVEVANLHVPGDTLIVYAGGRPLAGSTLALGGPGGYWVSGSSSFIDTVKFRGQGSDPTLDFGPWGGSVTFSTARTWHLDASTAPPSGAHDFHSVAIHELGHVLGIGTAESWDAKIDPQNRFTGEASVAAHGQTVPLDSIQAHWAAGTVSNVAGVSQTAVMVPSIGSGVSRRFTELDFAGLIDVGWEPAPAGDVLLDGRVGLRDAFVLVENFGQTSYGHWTIGDLTGDGKVNDLDLAQLQAHLGLMGGGHQSLSIPEPASGGMILIGAALLLGRSRRT